MAQSLDENTKFQVAEDVVSRSNPDGTTVVMKMDRGDTFYKIDGVASEVWSFIEKDFSFGSMKDEVMKSYDVEESQFLDDSKAFIEELLDKGLVTKRE